LLKEAPNPNAGLLWTRWLISEEGQKVFAQAGEPRPTRRLELNLFVLAGIIVLKILA
jgi:ABC-type Fe3+ transport system substrate-binding protein